MEKMYGKAKSTGSIFKIVFEGENYVHGILLEKPDCFGFSVTLPNENWEPIEDPYRIKVGDKVAVKSSPYTSLRPRTVLYIHQEKGDNRRWVVVAYKGDIPYSYKESELEKVF